MAKDAVEGLVDHQSFEATITTSTDDRFMIGSKNEKALLAAALKQQRAHRNMSIRDVAKRMGSNSPTAYARYESGNAALTFEKFTELLHAIDGEAEAVMTLVAKMGGRLKAHNAAGR